jgi:dihydrofolate reductase
MGRVVFDISMSLDGFMTAAGQTPEEPTHCRGGAPTAGDKVVSVMGGADIGRQYIAAGLVDEISIHLVPVLFGGGTQMFGDLAEQLQLEPVDVVDGPAATHLRYRVRR